MRVDRIADALEARFERVVEELAADGVAVARRPDHRDRGRLEEEPEGGLRGQPIAILEAAHRLVLEGGGEYDPDRTRLGGDLDRESALPEDLHHPVVLGHHLGVEDGDAVVDGDLRQVGEQQRGEPVSLEPVGDREGHLGAPASLADVDPLADQVSVADRHEPIALRVVDVRHRARRCAQVDAAREEPEHPGGEVQPLEEPVERILVVGADGPDMNSGAVAQRHVGLALGRICSLCSGRSVQDRHTRRRRPGARPA